MGIGAALDHARHPLDPDQRVHRRARACAGHRPVVGRRRHRGRARSGHRRVPARPLLVGLGVHRERADRHRRGDRGPVPRADLAQPGAAPARPGGRRLVDRRPRRAGCCHHRGAQQWLDRPADHHRLRGGRRRAHRLRAVGAPHRRADARRPPLRQRALQRRQRHGDAGVLRPVRVHLPRHPVPAVRARLLGVRRRRPHVAVRLRAHGDGPPVVEDGPVVRDQARRRDGDGGVRRRARGRLHLDGVVGLPAA